MKAYLILSSIIQQYKINVNSPGYFNGFSIEQNKPAEEGKEDTIFLLPNLQYIILLELDLNHEFYEILGSAPKLLRIKIITARNGVVVPIGLGANVSPA